YPSEKISLRSATADNVVIIDETGGRSRVIGEMDRPGAKELIFDDAVYIHLGRQYIVRKLDIENRTCHVSEKDVDYWTDAVVKTDIEVLTEDERYVLGSEDERAMIGREGAALAECALGDVLVRTQAEKFKKLRFHSHENIGYGEISLPPEEMQTRAFVLLLGPATRGGNALAPGGVEGDAALEAAVLAGAARLIHDMAPAFLMCDPRDIGRAERIRDPHFLVPAVYFYDKYPGGTGLAEALSRLAGRVVTAAAERLSRCGCGAGCPSCVGVDFAAAGVSAVRGPVSTIDGSLVKRRVASLLAALSRGNGDGGGA
ncbi:MAG: DUF1998 domain-containing protein, partial [Spirochaetaceae bacterium]|nr:DUF1998 domain-containing protein [Spirochaetaceae bacterium]